MAECSRTASHDSLNELGLSSAVPFVPNSSSPLQKVHFDPSFDWVWFETSIIVLETVVTSAVDIFGKWLTFHFAHRHFTCIRLHVIDSNNAG